MGDPCSFAGALYHSRPRSPDRQGTAVRRDAERRSTRRQMARSMWRGAIQFGLVTVPVKLYLATEARAGLSFNLLHKTCLNRIQMRTYCPEHGEIARKIDHNIALFSINRIQLHADSRAGVIRFATPVASHAAHFRF